MPTYARLKRFLAAFALALVSSAAVAAPAIPRSELVHRPLRLPVVFDDGAKLELEALLVKPAAHGRYPLALITHGSPREASARRRITSG